MASGKVLAAPSVRRLPAYLKLIRHYQNEGAVYISGARIARTLKLESIQVRKDLAITGITGQPKKGYATKPLIRAIEHFLGWDTAQKAALVGAGNLGSALLGHSAFMQHGLHIAAAFDSSSQKIGTIIHDIPIMDVREMRQIIARLGITIAILTVPSASAQEAANSIVSADITGIWNFTGEKLAVPPSVIVQNEDLSSGFAMLCVKMNIKNTTDH